MNRNKNSMNGLIGLFLISLYAVLFIPGAALADMSTVVVYNGQARVIEFEQPITRVAIADPVVADATVISSYQILVTGKSIGVSNFIVWNESMAYQQYKLIVRQEPALHQIMLEVNFAEIDKSALREFGMNFLIKQMKAGSERIDIGSFGGKVSEPSDPLQLGNTVDFFFSLPTQNFSSVMKALEENSLLKILATPNLSAVSGAEATFLAGGEFPVPIVSGSMGMQTVTIHFKEFGVRLKFLPTVLDSNLVNIKVTAEVSNLDFENGVTLSGFQIPSIVTRKAETTVELKEGQYMIMGGLLSNDLSETISKIPVLGHIPVLGRLFSSKRYVNNESELMITLTPKITCGVPKEKLPEPRLKIKEE